MPERERVNLTDAAISRLRPGAREYTVWDSRLVGLGVRVRPTGGQSFVLLQCAAGRSRRVSLGPVTIMTIAEARRECHVLMTEPEAADAVPARAVPLFRDFVAGEWKEARFERCKPSTKKGVVSVLEGQLLPAFGSKPLDRITLVRIRRWFDDFSRTAPGNANHALDLLRRIMNFAIACGHVDSNPAREMKPNPRPTLTRFLSREEVRRLHRVLDGQTRKGSREQADIIRLLLFTGCRRSEILRLRWSEVHCDALMLADGKTGPRKVPLNSQARLSSSAGCAKVPSCSPRRGIPTARAAATSHSGCQSALKFDPLSACNIDPPEWHGGGCPGSQQGGPARLRVAPCATRSEAAWGVPVGPPGQPGRGDGRRRTMNGS